MMQQLAILMRRVSRVGTLGQIILIVGLCVWAYYSSLSGAFLLDDKVLVTESPLVRGPNGLARIWFSADAADYWPVTNTSFWLEWRAWGLKPAGYHATNLGLHIAAAFLLWTILRKLSIPGAYLAALLFAMHPVNVESVAWISQRKNMLAMAFFLLSLWWYLKADEEKSSKAEDEKRGFGRWYWLSLLAFVLAMLSKGSVAVLPVLLLGLNCWQQRRIGLQEVLRTVPFFIVAGALTIVNLWFQTHGQEIVVRDANFSQRLAGAGAVVWFYLAKALAPIQLLFVYPNWRIEANELLWWLPLVAAVALTAALWWFRSSARTTWALPLLYAWGFFCVSLLPVLGFANVGFMKFSLVADHYQHVALIGVAALAAAGWARWQQKAQGAWRLVAIGVAILVVSAFALLTARQSRLYADPIALYTATLRGNPECWMAHLNLGGALLDGGKIEEAARHFEQALQLKPDYAEAYYNLGNCAARSGHLEEAIARFRQALQIYPNDIRMHNNLGGALMVIGRLEEAIQEFQQTLLIEPNYFEARYNLGSALFQIGQFQGAIDQYQQALTLRPDSPDVHFDLGTALTKMDRQQDAVAEYRQALQLRPGFTKAWTHLALAYAAWERPEEAVSSAEKAADIARSQNQLAQAQEIEDWVAKYRAEQKIGRGTSSQPSGASREP